MTYGTAYGLTSPPPADWRHHGACATHDEPDIWFAGRNGSEARAQTNEAQDICYGCPVLQQCGQWALDAREVWGVWGGMTETQRRSVLRRRGIRVDVPDGKPAKPKPKPKPKTKAAA